MHSTAQQLSWPQFFPWVATFCVSSHKQAMGIPRHSAGGPPWAWHNFKRSQLLLWPSRTSAHFPLPGPPCTFRLFGASSQVVRQGTADRCQPCPHGIPEPECVAGCMGVSGRGQCLPFSWISLALGLCFFLGDMGTIL